MSLFNYNLYHAFKSKKLYLFYFIGYFFAKCVETAVVYTYSPTDDLFLQQVPQVWQSYLLAILLYIFAQIAINEISKFYNYERKSPFISLFGSLEQELITLDDQKVDNIKKEGHAKFKAHLDKDFSDPRQHILLSIFMLLTMVLILYNAISGEPASGYLPEGTMVTAYDNPVFLFPAMFIIGFFLFVPAIYIAFGGIIIILRLVIVLRRLSSDEELSEYLTIKQLNNIIDLTGGSQTLQSGSNQDLTLSPSLFEYYAGFSLKSFKRNSRPIAQLALRITVMIFFGLAVINAYAVFVTLPLVESNEVRSSLIRTYIVLNIIIFVALVWVFIYPQLAIHEMILKGKTALVNRLEGITQLILAQIIIKSQKGEFDESAGSVALLNELNSAIERITSMLSWPFDYRQLVAFIGTAAASSFTFIFGLITQ